MQGKQITTDETLQLQGSVLGMAPHSAQLGHSLRSRETVHGSGGRGSLAVCNLGEGDAWGFGARAVDGNRSETINSPIEPGRR